MTTIAYRDGLLASDRRISDPGRGLIEGSTTKIFRRETDGALIGVAGSLGVAERFARWFLAGENGDMPALRDKDANATAEAIVIRPNCKVENIYELGSIYIESDYHAIGSGSIAALAAMDMGADARRAVEIACGRDVGSGNGIDELHLNKVVVAVLQPAESPAPTTVSDSGEGEDEQASNDAQPQQPATPIPEGEGNAELEAFLQRDGAVKHNGGPRPVPVGWRLEILTRGCGEWPVRNIEEIGESWWWEGEESHPTNIIAYRVVEAKSDGETPAAAPDPITQAASLPTPEDDLEARSDSAVFGEDKRSWLGLFGGKKLAEEGV